MSELAVVCADGVSLTDLLKLVVVDATTGLPYIDCDNKDESIESILKRCIVILDDGTYAVQIVTV